MTVRYFMFLSTLFDILRRWKGNNERLRAIKHYTLQQNSNPEPCDPKSRVLITWSFRRNKNNFARVTALESVSIPHNLPRITSLQLCHISLPSQPSILFCNSAIFCTIVCRPVRPSRRKDVPLKQTWFV